MKNPNIESLIDELLYYSHQDSNKYLQYIEDHYNCKIFLNVEKYNELQYDYYYEIDFYKSENLFIEIENGINNGTQLNDSYWGPKIKLKTFKKDKI